MAYEMVMPYHLHMPSYFLETFTEYPQYSTRKTGGIQINCHCPGILYSSIGREYNTQAVAVKIKSKIKETLPLLTVLLSF